MVKTESGTPLGACGQYAAPLQPPLQPPPPTPAKNTRRGRRQAGSSASLVCVFFCVILRQGVLGPGVQVDRARRGGGGDFSLRAGRCCRPAPTAQRPPTHHLTPSPCLNAPFQTRRLLPPQGQSRLSLCRTPRLGCRYRGGGRDHQHHRGRPLAARHALPSLRAQTYAGRGRHWRRPGGCDGTHRCRVWRAFAAAPSGAGAGGRRSSRARGPGGRAGGRVRGRVR